MTFIWLRLREMDCVYPLTTLSETVTQRILTRWWIWVELSLFYAGRSVDQFILVSGSPLGPMTRFYPYPFFIDNCFVVLPVGRPLWREDGSVTYSAIVDWSGHWGPITIHYCLIWDCVPSSSPLTARRDYGGGILTRLHMGRRWIWTFNLLLY
jgi:hypothetical protein